MVLSDKHCNQDISLLSVFKGRQMHAIKVRPSHDTKKYFPVASMIERIFSEPKTKCSLNVWLMW